MLLEGPSPQLAESVELDRQVVPSAVLRKQDLLDDAGRRDSADATS
jgi:hypothetical protein